MSTPLNSRHTFRLCVFLVIIVQLGFPFSANALNCREKLNSFSKKVIDTNGLWLFVKDENRKLPPVEQKWRGFWTIPNSKQKKTIKRRLGQIVPKMVSQKLFGGKSYEATPNLMLENMFGEWTFEKMGQRLKPRVWLILPPTLFAGFFIFSWMLNGVDKGSKTLFFDRDIDNHGSLYDYFLENDFRFMSIKRELERGQITLHQARINVFMTGRLPYTQYLNSRGYYIGASASYQKEKLLNFIIFHPLQGIVENGIGPTPGYIVPTNRLGPVSDATVSKLFSYLDELAIQYELASRLAHAPYILADVPASVFLGPARSDMLNDPLNRQLLNAGSLGYLSSGQVMFYLQLESYWNANFKQWHELGITPLYFNGKNYENRELTPDEIHAEIRSQAGLSTP